MTNRANTICLLEILKEYSDADHIMQMQEIIAKMKAVYSLEVDRRTVYSSVDLLKELGYDISDYNDNGVGYYLRERDFETSEIRLLMDAVYSYQAIPTNQTEKLISKLQKLLNSHERKQYRSLKIVKTDKKTRNAEVFLNIEILDEAIQRKNKVKFTYLEYGLDKNLKPRREKKYTVNPYQLICMNEHYYLLCKMAYRTKISLYRIDLMQDVEITDYLLDDTLTEKELLTAENKTVYAWYGDVETVELRCRNFCIGDVIDKFGTGVAIQQDGDDHFIVTLRVAPWGVKYWALQYLSFVEVLSPAWLREEVIASVQNNPYTEVRK